MAAVDPIEIADGDRALSQGRCEFAPMPNDLSRHVARSSSRNACGRQSIRSLAIRDRAKLRSRQISSQSMKVRPQLSRLEGWQLLTDYAVITPVSTSPAPPVAIPGLPVEL